MEEPTVLDDSIVQREETAEFDMQWSRIIELELAPHPKHTRPEVVRMDYPFDEDGVLRVRVRAANAGYMLRRWSVARHLCATSAAPSFKKIPGKFPKKFALLNQISKIQFVSSALRASIIFAPQSRLALTRLRRKRSASVKRPGCTYWDAIERIKPSCQ